MERGSVPSTFAAAELIFRVNSAPAAPTNKRSPIPRGDNNPAQAFLTAPLNECLSGLSVDGRTKSIRDFAAHFLDDLLRMFNYEGYTSAK